MHPTTQKKTKIICVITSIYNAYKYNVLYNAQFSVKV